MWLYGIVIGRCDCYKSTFDPCDNDGSRMVSDMLGLENLTPLSQMGLENLTPQMGSLERMVIYRNGCLTPLSQMAEDNSALKSEAVAGLTALFSPVKKQVRHSEGGQRSNLATRGYPISVVFITKRT